MLEGKVPTLCHPGCVPQPVTLPGGPFSHFIYWHHPPTWHSPPIAGLGLRARTALAVREAGRTLEHREQPWEVLAMVCWGWGYLRKSGHGPN